MKLLPLACLVIAFGCSHRPKEEAKVTPVLSEAYQFGLPLVLMDLTREEMTNVSSAQQSKLQAPINQFSHMTQIPNAKTKNFTRPGQDTLMSSAWIDLSAGPQVIEIPSTKGRYYLMSLIDAWTNVYASAGNRTLGTSARKLVVIGPKWNGSIPAGVELVRSPTDLTWIVGRIEVKGQNDLRNVTTLQKSFKVYPLESFGKRFSPPRSRIDSKIAKGNPIEKLFALSTEEYFNRLNRLMLNNPASVIDKDSLARFAPYGISPGAKFSIDALKEDERSAIRNLPQISKANFENNTNKLGHEVNGWMMPNSSIGNYVKDYNLRAQVAYSALGSSLPLDIISPTALNDGNGDKLNGSKRYILHFNKDQIPMVKSFWSLTVYGQDSYFVKNPFNKYSLSSRDKLSFNQDGSLDIYLQTTNPGSEKRSNWLPIPSGDFSVTARLYSPSRELLDEKYGLPAIMPSLNMSPVSMINE